MAQVFSVVVTNYPFGTGTQDVELEANSIRAATTYLAGPTTNYPSESWDYDRRQPIEVSSFTAPESSASNPITATTADFTLVLNNVIPVTQLTSSDFTISNSNASISSISPTSGNAITFTIAVTQPTHSSGTYTVSLNADSISASTGGGGYLQGPANSYTSDAVTYNTRVVATAAWSAVSYCETTNKLSGSLTFSGAAITGIAAEDFEVLNACLLYTSPSPRD